MDLFVLQFHSNVVVLAFGSFPEATSLLPPRSYVSVLMTEFFHKPNWSSQKRVLHKKNDMACSISSFRVCETSKVPTFWTRILVLQVSKSVEHFHLSSII
jgi:hypothetical protein